jgi:hypothetical protein
VTHGTPGPSAGDSREIRVIAVIGKAKPFGPNYANGRESKEGRAESRANLTTDSTDETDLH